MSHYHAIVWLDHSQAHIMQINPSEVEESIVHPATPHPHLHHHAGTLGSGKLAEDPHYYQQIADALKGVQEILVVGPAHAKLAFIKHLHKFDHDMLDKIIGIETVDHPTDPQLVAYARSYFKAADRMR